MPNCLAIQIDNGVNPDLTVTKTVDKSTAIVGDILNYESTLFNNGSLNLTDIVFTDSIPVGTQFVENSVYIDGVSQAGLNPSVGFPLSDLAVGANVVVEFDVLVN